MDGVINRVTNACSISISSIKENNRSYNLVLTGTIGAGKTTICRYLDEILKQNSITHTNYFEYNDMDELGNTMLQRRANGTISALTFQSYILDVWKNTLAPDRSSITIFERLPDDSVVCFCNMANYFNDLSDEELVLLLSKVRRLSNTPSYFRNDFNFDVVANNEISDALIDIINIMCNDLRNGVTNRIIGINVSGAQSYERVLKRARDGENYSFATVLQYCGLYGRLFKKLYSGGFKNAFEIGSLLN